MVEVYHCDGEDAGAWVGVEVVNSCLMGCGWRIGGYYVEREREPALHGLDFPSLFFYIAVILPLTTHCSSLLTFLPFPASSQNQPLNKRKKFRHTDTILPRRHRHLLHRFIHGPRIMRQELVILIDMRPDLHHVEAVQRRGAVFHQHAVGRPRGVIESAVGFWFRGEG